ncbi:MAG TPA: hypothetical protein VGS22_23145 [Thermoanaerobaculia bacterium]|nr:hypothetical protein [Thermoanaerobaculia bacterium]
MIYHLHMDDTPLPFDRKRRPSQSGGPQPVLSAAEPLSRRFAEGLMLRGERASEEGDHSRAVALFERAAITFETTGDQLFAADAYLELGLALLYLQRGEEIPALAPRVAGLASTPAPVPGSALLIRVFAALLRQANDQPGPFVDLVDRRRKLRFPAAAPIRATMPPQAESAS